MLHNQHVALITRKLESIEEAVSDLQDSVNSIENELDDAKRDSKLDERLTRLEIKIDRALKLIALGVDDGKECPSTLNGRICTCNCD